jgi:hypothetical protein
VFARIRDGERLMFFITDTAHALPQPRTFTNGRLTFLQEIEGTQSPRVLFARGRMVPTPCARVD